MSLASVLLSSVFLASQIHPSLAADNTHAGYLASVATYKPMAGFNHVVGTTRFIGYFLQSSDACKVTVFEAAAFDEALISPPRRMDLDIPAGGRSAFDTGDGSALAIACTADADAIKIAPQYRAAVSVAPVQELSR
jgi:hypothetical protein